jgi:CPA2 family monovalent cation:H+ antiporter-2
MNHAHVFTDLMILMGAATLMATILHSLRLPLIVGYFMAGAIVGPSGFGWISSAPEIETLTEIGSVLLMFTIGLEFSFSKLKQWQSKMLRLGSVQMAGTLLIFALIFHFAFEMDWSRAFFFGGILSLSSTAVILKILNDARDLEAPYGATTMSVLIFQDLAIIPMIFAFPVLAGRVDFALVPGLGEIASWSLRTVAAFTALAIGARWIVPLSLKYVVRTRSRELFFFCLMFFCLGFAFLLQEVGLSLSLGAFFAGVLISESPYGRQANADFGFLRDTFLGLFFTTIGMLLVLPFLAEHAAFILFLFIVYSLTKISLAYATFALQRYRFSTSLTSAFLLFQIGEFSLILAAQGRKFGLLSPDENQYLLSISVLSLALTPWMYKFAQKLAPKTGFASRFLSSTTPRADAPAQENISEHAIIIGYGLAGQNVAHALETLQVPYIVIDLNPDTAKIFKLQKHQMIFGDARQPEILHQAGIERARLVMVTVSGLGMAEGVLTQIHHLHPGLPAIVRLQYLRDVETGSNLAGADLVVAELETSMEIVNRALRFFGASAEEIDEMLRQSRKQIAMKDLVRGKLDRPDDSNEKAWIN